MMKILRKNKRAILGWALMVLVVAGVFYGVVAGAADEPLAVQEEEHWTLSMLKFTAAPVVVILGWILYLPVYFFGYLITKVLVAGLIEVAKYNDFLREDFITETWVIIRDMANIIIVLGIIVIAFGTLFKIQQYSYKALLPKLALAAILINFSKTIVGVLIDISQVVMLTFVYSFEDVVAGNIIYAIGIDKILAVSGSFQTWGTDMSLAVLGSLILATLVLAVTSVILLVLLIYLVVRIIYLWIALVLSPLLFALPVLPIGGRFKEQITSSLTKYLLAGPIMAFFLWMAFYVMSRGFWPNSPESISSPGGERLTTFLADFGYQDVLRMVFVVVLLFISLVLASTMGVAGGKIAGNFVSRMGQIGSKALMAPFKGAWGMAKFGERKFFKATGFSGFNPVRLYQKYKDYAANKRMTDEAEGTKKAGDRAQEHFREGHTRRGALALAFGSPNDFAEQYFGAQGLKKFARTMIGKEKTGIVRGEEVAQALEKNDEETEEVKGALSDEAKEEGKKAFIEERSEGHIANRAREFQAAAGTGGNLLHIGPGGKLVVEDMNDAKAEGEVNRFARQKAKEEAEANGEIWEGEGALDEAEKKRRINNKVDQFQKEKKNLALYEDEEGNTHVKELNADTAKALAKHSLNNDARSQAAIEAYVDKNYSDQYVAKGATVIEGRLKKLEAEKARINIGGFSESVVESMEKQLENLEKEFEAIQTELGSATPYTGEHDRLRVLLKKIDEDKKELQNRISGVGLDEETKNKNKALNKDRLKKINKEEAFLTGARKMAVDGKLSDDLETEDQLKARQEQLAGEKKKIQSRIAQAPRAFHADAAYRQVESEAMEQVPKEPMEASELVSMIRDALRKKDKPLIGALLKKAAIDYNDNEFLDGFGYDSNFDGMRKFQEDILEKKAGMSKQMSTSLINEIGYINEDKGHYETSRMATVENGIMRMNTPAEHAAAVANENLKQNTRNFMQNTNRLGWGGETADGGYKMSLSGKLTLIGMQDDVVYRIPRGEFNQTALQKIAKYQLKEIKELERLGLLTARSKEKGYEGMMISQILERKLKEMERRRFVADYSVLKARAQDLLAT